MDEVKGVDIYIIVKMETLLATARNNSIVTHFINKIKTEIPQIEKEDNIRVTVRTTDIAFKVYCDSDMKRIIVTAHFSRRIECCIVDSSLEVLPFSMGDLHALFLLLNENNCEVYEKRLLF